MTVSHTLRCIHRNVTLEGFTIRPTVARPRGTVLMFPGATGPGDSFRKAMRELADEGYLAIGIDMYGVGADLSTPQAAGAYFTALLNAPELLRERVVTWFETVCALPEVDPARVSAIGYCFGGKCVLELARSGAPVASVTSFHGLLTTHAPARTGEVSADIAVWSGGRDPYAPRADLDALRVELDAAGASYQVTLFSNAQHSFTDPDHDGIADGIGYDACAHRVAWVGTLAMLAERIGRQLPP
ncbi:dienelactone hydrolase family protein [Novosphingobium mangrovi (ex Huang et al. 2023)]|uniref:Dienelactone hydrolase family protein n=1 Tax=Novosphingobium mangrovi (ex Huang et al. 2023) TaxID=2976432 RepID=A0ABT2I4Q7_9SPHN|nr:dienelactone hydrolase family protein [Novosphingobium mangrovi (ex Huang et al. 2023)]MCT2399785.1 dienelactone hydrolase family protein [Novosphingobium mangrovi (ex Huang et al. 2023)]